MRSILIDENNEETKLADDFVMVNEEAKFENLNKSNLMEPLLSARQ